MQTANHHRWLKGCMWLAVVVGVYARLRGLGTWPWATDEFLIAQSVDNILQHGIPAFDCGGYYMRGITLQYLIAPLFALGVQHELAARLVPVAFSFAMLPAVYFLGKRLSGVTVACVSVALLSISLWEIEFARFARMYVPFQAIFLWYLLALHRVVVDRQAAAYGWMWLLSLAGVFTWAGGLFLLLLNFLPAATERAPGRARGFAVSAALLILGYGYSSLSFRFMGSQPALPPDVSMPAAGSHFLSPPILAFTLASYPVWIMGALAVLVVSLAALFILMTRVPATGRERTAWAALIALATLNLFGCVVIGLILAVLLGWIDLRHAWRRSVPIALLALAANFFFWIAYALFTDAPHHLFPGFGPGGELSKLAVVLFKYPDVFDLILSPWLNAVPVLTIVLGGLACLATVWAIRGPDGERLSGLRLTLAATLIMVALVGVAETKYARTRYTFFLLPVLYLIALTIFHRWIIRPIRSRPRRGAVLGLALLALVVGSEDFGWAHLVHVDSKGWNYRLPLDSALSQHFYPRRDVRTPAHHVNRRARPNDLIILVSSLAITDYLKRTDYLYWNYHWIEFAGISCDRGRRERWSGNRLLYRKADLLDVIRGGRGDIWLIAKSVSHVPQQIEAALGQGYAAKPVYRGYDGGIVVWKIDNPG